MPLFRVRPDKSRPVQSVHVFYTLQGKSHETPQDRLETMHRFWHHAAATLVDGEWVATLPLNSTNKPLWVYANVGYALDEPVSGVGYYYGSYSSDRFNLSSVMQVATSEELKAASVQATLQPSLLIEDFAGDWQQEWFTYRPDEWARSTNKLNSDVWKAPLDAVLSIEVQAGDSNKLVVRLDDFAAEVSLSGDEEWQSVVLRAGDFHNFSGAPLEDWNGIRQLKLSPAEHLRPGRGETGAARLLGANWKGSPPKFRSLGWRLAPVQPD